MSKFPRKLPESPKRRPKANFLATFSCLIYQKKDQNYRSKALTMLI